MTKHHVVPQFAGRVVFGSWLTTSLATAGVLLPKCPLCVAAYLCLFGVSASSARAAARLGLPLCVGMVCISVLATAVFVARRGRRLARRVHGSRSCTACASSTQDRSA